MFNERDIELEMAAQLAAGEIETGLFRVGAKFVVMDRVDDEVTFVWFDEMNAFGNVPAA